MALGFWLRVLTATSPALPFSIGCRAGYASPYVLQELRRLGPPDYLGSHSKCTVYLLDLSPECSRACVLGTALVPFVKILQGGVLRELSCLAGGPISLTVLFYTLTLSFLELL